eukprot:jgi/Botrbrau1/18713/Bobra.0386s0038.1
MPASIDKTQLRFPYSSSSPDGVHVSIIQSFHPVHTHMTLHLLPEHKPAGLANGYRFTRTTWTF